MQMKMTQIYFHLSHWTKIEITEDSQFKEHCGK